MKQLLKTIAGALLYYSGLFRLFIHWNRKKVVVLAYHSITDNPKDVPSVASPYWVLSSRTFRRQMRFVKKHFTVVKCGEAVAYLSSPAGCRPNLEKAIILTFDDGFENHVSNAVPVLDGLGLKGVFFAVGRPVAEGLPPIPYELCELLDMLSASDLEKAVGIESDIATTLSTDDEIRRSFYRAFLLDDYDGQLRAVMDLRGKCPAKASACRYASADDLRELASRGHEVGGHSYDHVRMTALNDQQLASDIARSREALETALHDRVYSFCYPYGIDGTYDARVSSAVKAGGFTCAFTSVEGMNDVSADLFMLKRMPIMADSGFFPFVLKITGVEMVLKRVFGALR